MKRLVIELYPQVIQDAWALWEAFRKLGFTSDEIDVTVSRSASDPMGGPWVFVIVSAQGKEFTAHVGPIGSETPERISELWGVWARTLSAGEFEESKLQKLYRKRFLERDPGPASLVVALQNKGFRIPGPPDVQGKN